MDWGTIILSVISGGGITSIVLALMGKIKTNHEKAIDVSGIIDQMQETMTKANKEFERYCIDTIERLRDDNDCLRKDKNELKEVITNANDCEFLRSNPSAECVVISSDRNRYKRKVCDACHYKDTCIKSKEGEE